MSAPLPAPNGLVKVYDALKYFQREDTAIFASVHALTHATRVSKRVK